MTEAGVLSTRVGGLVVVGLGLLAGAAAAIQPTLTAVAAVGLVCTLVALRWPTLLVVAMYAGILFDRLGVTGAKLGDFPITASKLSVLATIGLWTAHAGLSGARFVRWHAVQNAMLGVIGVTAVGIALANSMSTGKFTLYGLLMMTVMVTVVYAILAEARLEPLYRGLAAVLLAALVASVSRPNVPGADGRVSGTMGDPNEWATTVLLLAPLLLGGLVGDDRRVGQLLRVGLVALVPLGILRSESRAALVVLTLVLPGCLYLMRSRRDEVLACGGLAVAAAPFLIDLDTALGRFWKLLDNLQGGAAVEDESLEERSELFRQGVQLFKDHWFIGAGPGNFETATGFVSHEGTLRPAHNTYLEIASEQGIVGLSAAFVFLGTVAWSLHRGWKGARTERDRSRVLGAALGLGAFALMAATLGLLTFAMGYLALGFTLAVLHQARSDEGSADGYVG